MSVSTSTFERLASAAGFARRVARFSETRLERLRFHLWHAADAGRAYDTICRHDPGRRLDGRTRRRITAYAREVLGSRLYAPWLRAYAAWAGEFREGWIPDNYYGLVIQSHGQFTPGRLSRYKTIARRLLATDLLPDVAYHLGGSWLSVDGTPVRAEDVDDLVFADASRVVVKFDVSMQGVGVHVLRRGEDSVLDFAGRGDFVVQRFIRQSPFFERFVADNVATVRITTVRTPDLPAHTRGRYLKFGRAGQRSYTSARGVVAPIVDEDGRLGDVGALYDWSPVTAHPDSGEVFAGTRVPSFAEACRAVEALHDTLPQVEVIGWDVSITDRDEVRIMEWNGGHSNITFSEATIGPCFRGLGWEDRWRR